MFWGTHDHVLDDKGRTSLPKEFREFFAKDKAPPWITALQECLAIFPASEFEARRARLNGDPDVHSIERLQRLIIGLATPCVVDKQGRFSIPPRLRKWAGLDREIALSGVGNRIEIWDRARHLAELEITRRHYEEYSRDLRTSRE